MKEGLQAETEGAFRVSTQRTSREMVITTTPHFLSSPRKDHKPLVISCTAKAVGEGEAERMMWFVGEAIIPAHELKIGDRIRAFGHLRFTFSGQRGTFSQPDGISQMKVFEFDRLEPSD